MNRVSKLLFWIGISWTSICLFILILGQFLPFEFSDENTAKGFYGVIACTFPISILLTLAKPSLKKAYKTVAIIVAIISIPFFALYTFGLGMCGYITDHVLFINKSDSALKIIERHYDCGAYDSNMPKYEFFEIKKLSTQILYSKKVDTTTLDKSHWLRNNGGQ